LSTANSAAQRGKGLILLTLCLAALIINLDTTIVNVALPTLVRQLNATTQSLQWVVDAYSLVFAALVLAAGSLGDRFGRKGVLLAGAGRVRRREPGRLARGHLRPADHRAGGDGGGRGDDVPGHLVAVGNAARGSVPPGPAACRAPGPARCQHPCGTRRRATENLKAWLQVC
jgi:hypothetical protein